MPKRKVLLWGQWRSYYNTKRLPSRLLLPWSISNICPKPSHCLSLFPLAMYRGYLELSHRFNSSCRMLSLPFNLQVPTPWNQCRDLIWEMHWWLHMQRRDILFIRSWLWDQQLLRRRNFLPLPSRHLQWSLWLGLCEWVRWMPPRICLPRVLCIEIQMPRRILLPWKDKRCWGPIWCMPCWKIVSHQMWNRKILPRGFFDST